MIITMVLKIPYSSHVTVRIIGRTTGKQLLLGTRFHLNFT